ncbi:AP-4 complex subunit mu-1-like [Oratosquilla oratoria]|uniref:AP-4 complex subunit mu-1-like n=1 Tax=Oratosquilla oratoria TaxID=337810 RepID=UPI003F75923D
MYVGYGLQFNSATPVLQAPSQTGRNLRTRLNEHKRSIKYGQENSAVFQQPETTDDDSVKESVFDTFLSELTSSPHGDPPPCFTKNGYTYVYVFRHDLYWAAVVRPGSTTEECGPLFVAESLGQVCKACATLCGTITQHSISANATLITEILIEVLDNGFLQVLPPEKIRAHIYSDFVAPKETSHLSLSPGLFGLEKCAPSSAGQQSVLAVDSGKREVFVDVVEKVWAAVAATGAVLRSEITGSIILRCFLPGAPMLTITLNTDLSPAPKEGFATNIHMAEVEFGSGVNISNLGTHRQISVQPPRGEMSLIKYSLPPDQVHQMPFSLSATVTALTASDAELKLKLKCNTGMGSISPKVVFHTVAPLTTATVMTRTTGPREQNVNFNSEDKSLIWTIYQFPGGASAQAIIRLVDAGGMVQLESGELEFEVSKWVSSGIHVEKVKILPQIDNLKKWVRYLTTSDCFTIRLS